MLVHNHVTDDEIIRVFSAALNADMVHVNRVLIINIVRACIEADRERTAHMFAKKRRRMGQAAIARFITNGGTRHG